MADVAAGRSDGARVDGTAFHGSTSLEALVVNVEPLRSLDGFEVDDLTDEESAAFWSAVEG